MQIKICNFCKKEYKTKHPESKYCSKSCASKKRFNPGVNIWKNGLNEINTYVLGIIASDGCLSFDKHSHRENINITLNDKELIEKLNKILTPDKKLYHYKDSYSINFKNDEAIEILKKYNITYRKSLTYEFPDNVPKKYLKDFIRGYFDGDGSVYINKTKNNGKTYKYVNVSFTSGSLIFLKKLEKTLEKNNINSHIIKDCRKNVFYLKIYDKKSIQNFKKMIYYKDDLLKLDRKYEMFT